MNKFELFFLDFGFSWTISKVIPYILFLIIGILAFLFLLKRTKNFKKRLFIGLPLFVLPIVVYFVLYPIYDGDFSNESYIPERTNFTEMKGSGLFIIAIPGCPFCLESIDNLKQMKDRNPNLQIQFIVCTDSDEDLKIYQQASEGKFSVKKGIDKENLVQAAMSSFPSFIVVKDNVIKNAWNNSSFGVVAIDEVESMDLY